MLPMKEAMTKQLRSLLVHWRRNNTVRALALLVLLPYFTWIAKTLGGLSVVSETSPSPDFGIYPDVPSPRNASEQSSAANVTVQALSVILAEQNTTTTTTTATSDTGKQPRSRSNVEPENPSAFHSELQSFYNTTSDGTNLWDDPSSKLPSWMKRYLNWHKHQRAKVESSKTQKGVFSSNRFLVMYCSPVDNNCGGTSDRLKPIPFMLRIAYYTKRLLFIHWTKPARLEEFLVPPKGGLDWRLPDWMAKEFLESRRVGTMVVTEGLMLQTAKTNVTLIRSRYQNYHSGMYWYDDQRVGEEEPTYNKLYHELWRLTFTPSPGVRAIIESEMQKMGLIPGEYTGAHLRALYAIKTRENRITNNWAKNALNCATELRPQKTIFFTSDSPDATHYAKQYAAERNATLATRVPNPNPPLHLDKVPDWRKRPVSDFYDAFVDLYILAQADCVTYNKGGYGVFGLLLNRNVTCGFRQDAMGRPRIRRPCHWVSGDPSTWTNGTRRNLPESRIINHDPIYLDPMDS